MLLLWCADEGHFVKTSINQSYEQEEGSAWPSFRKKFEQVQVIETLDRDLATLVSNINAMREIRSNMIRLGAQYVLF